MFPMNISLDFCVKAPRGSSERFGIVVGRTASVQFKPCARDSHKPGSEGSVKALCSTPLRRSPSIRSTREPVFAIAIAKLDEVRDFPSLGTELEISSLFGGPLLSLR